MADTIKSRHIEVYPLEVDKFVKLNDLAQVTNPVFFSSSAGDPTTDGLLSNSIFGITTQERATTFAYISLGNNVFIEPLPYRVWSRLDSNVKDCMYQTKKFKLQNGSLVEDPNGQTGGAFLKKVLLSGKYKIEETESLSRNRKIKFLFKYKDRIFIDKMIVIPAFYRDVDIKAKSMGVGDINRLYTNLISNIRALNESTDYGLTLEGAIYGKTQDLLLQIYDYLAKGKINGEDATIGLDKKKGLIRQTMLSKTTDYSSRLIISCPIIAKNHIEDMIVDPDHAAVPLASLCANYLPFMLFHCKRWFANTIQGTDKFPVYNFETKKVDFIPIDEQEVLSQFSEAKIKEELDNFIHGFANRLKPITIQLPNKKTANFIFQGFECPDNITEKMAMLNDKYKEFNVLNRPMTWCDLFFVVACEVTADKAVLITRYPIDSYFNQFPIKVRVSSTNETVHMVVNGHFYQFYPKITLDMIGKYSATLFSDTLKIPNIRLSVIDGDYDGDQVSCKSLYSVEANEELRKAVDKKINYIGLGGINRMVPEIEAIQTMFNLTLILPDKKNTLSTPTF